jgi:ketosteroid isomerase-like protein
MTRFQIVGAALTVAIAGSLAACNVTAPAKPADAPKADTGKIADAIKADVAQGVADFNARDADKASAHNAPDVVFMFHGAPNTVGADANLAAAKQTYAADKTAHVAVSNESVDVPASGDMAVYHSTYNVSFTDPKTKKPGTDQGNYLAGYKQQADGTWKIEWVVISNTPPTAGTPPAKPMAAKSPGGGQDNGQH